ncbi:hypothetical protein D9M68_623790 [compost metagenome]
MLSLALNASPFMRFDGYFILSDLLDFPNLHERSSALARVALRRTLLGLDEPWPEPFAPGRRRLLVAFAIATWLYRLALFLGIAVAVYLLFFKLLGIFLFAVEIAWFIVLPVWRELRHWWAARQRVPGRRKRLLWAVLGLTLLLLAVPWRSQVHGHGVVRAEQQLRVFTPYPALLQQMRSAGTVKRGDPLVVLDEPDIAARVRGNEASLRSYQARLSGLLADPGGLAQQRATRQRLDVEFEEIRAARSEMARLTIKAPFAGQWRDVSPDWRPGQWVGRQEALGVLVDPRSWQVDAYVEQDQVHRLALGERARFYPSGQLTPLAGQVVGIGSTRVNQLAHPMLASHYGGPIATTTQDNGLSPSAALFHVVIQLDTPPPELREMPGHVQIEGARRSLLGEALTYTLAILLRESGF